MEIEFHTDLNGVSAASGIGFEVLQIVREGLTNIARHADATRARIAIRRRANDIEIVVSDDGRGFPAAPEEADAELWPELPSGVAPWSIRERVTALGGTLALRSRRGKGSELRVSLPLTG